MHVQKDKKRYRQIIFFMEGCMESERESVK
jgi:hypothetical protein